MSSKLSALTDLAGGQVPSDLAYIDQVSAGVNGSKKSTLNDLFSQPAKNITSGVIEGIAGSGLNIAGVDLPLSGGRGTGNAQPGLFALRYPLTGASGSTLQSLSTASFPPWVNMHLRNNGDINIVNSAAETSILGASQNNSTKTIEAGLARIGRNFLVRIYGTLTTTGTPTLQIRLKLIGGVTVTIADTGAVVIANNTNSGAAFLIEAFISIYAVGVGGVVHVPSMKVSYPAANGGALNTFSAGGGSASAVAVDLSVAQTFDMTEQFSVAAVGNTLSLFTSVIDMSR